MTDTEKQHRRKIKKRMIALEKKIKREEKEIKKLKGKDLCSGT